MAQRVATLDELKGHTLEGVLYEVAESDESLTVVLGEDGAVVISPEVRLKPLSELEGRSPEGWKNAIYEGGNALTSRLEQLKRMRFGFVFRREPHPLQLFKSGGQCVAPLINGILPPF